MIFRKLAPNGRHFMLSVDVPKKEANKIIKENSNNQNKGWLSFSVVNNEVLVGYNLWNKLDLNKYKQ